MRFISPEIRRALHRLGTSPDPDVVMGTTVPALIDELQKEGITYPRRTFARRTEPFERLFTKDKRAFIIEGHVPERLRTYGPLPPMGGRRARPASIMAREIYNGAPCEGRLAVRIEKGENGGEPTPDLRIPEDVGLRLWQEGKIGADPRGFRLYISRPVALPVRDGWTVSVSVISATR